MGTIPTLTVIAESILSVSSLHRRHLSGANNKAGAALFAPGSFNVAQEPSLARI